MILNNKEPLLPVARLEAYVVYVPGFDGYFRNDSIFGTSFHKDPIHASLYFNIDNANGAVSKELWSDMEVRKVIIDTTVWGL